MGSESSLPVQDQAPGIWKWQSNPNPWDATEPQEWTTYPPEINQEIEKAYLEKTQKIQIGKHYINVKQMVQINSEDSKKQIRVQRVVEEKNMNTSCREERFCGEAPKITLENEFFAGASGFIDFLKTKFEDLCLKKLNLELLNKMYEGLRKEASLLGEKEKSQVEEIICEIDTKAKKGKCISSDDEIFKQVLRAYTKDTFLYSRLNNLLREEKWTEMENLAPFLFVICQACDSYYFKTEIINDFRNLLFGKQTYLYRGAYLSTEELESYDPKVNKYIAWNALTSTSRNISVAKNFAKTKCCQQADKIPTLFTIISKYHLPSGFEHGIEVEPFSVYPSEEEVILPPGTSFKIICSKNQQGVQNITLEIVVLKDCKEGANESSQAQTTLQNLKQLCQEKRKTIKMCYLAEDIVKEADKLIKENESLVKLHILEAYMTAKVIKSLMDRLSLKSRLKELKLCNIEFTEETFDIFVKGIPMTHITRLDIEQKEIVFSKERKNSFYLALAQSSVKELGIMQSDHDRNWRLDSVPRSRVTCISTNCKFRPEELQKFLGSLAETEIEDLNLDCLIAPWYSNIFIKYLPQTNLKKLTFNSVFHFEAKELTKFLDVLPQTKISGLVCSSFNMANQGIIAISNALYTLNLQCLGVTIGSEGCEIVESFGKSLAASKIKSLQLEICICNKEHTRIFIEGIVPYLVQMGHLESLELKRDDFEIEPALYILENLVKFETLTSFYFKTCLINEKGNDKYPFIQLVESMRDVLPLTKIKKILMPLPRDWSVEELIEVESSEEWKGSIQKIIDQLDRKYLKN